MGKWFADDEESEYLSRVDEELRQHENRDWRILPLVVLLEVVIVALILWLYFRRT